MNTTQKDARYSTEKEWHGEAKRSIIVRFCGEWVSKAVSRSDASHIIAQHMVLRHTAK